MWSLFQAYLKITEEENKSDTHTRLGNDILAGAFI